MISVLDPSSAVPTELPEGLLSEGTGLAFPEHFPQVLRFIQGRNMYSELLIT